MSDLLFCQLDPISDRLTRGRFGETVPDPFWFLALNITLRFVFVFNIFGVQA